MPKISLYRTDVADPDASHDVRAPGGYEWWYFDAEDTANDRQIVAIFLNGFIFHPGYLRAYRRYMNRPTRFAPPLPQDYACAYFVVYEKGKIRKQFMAQYPRADFIASMESPDVRLGPNAMCRDDAGNYQLQLSGTPWKLTGQGPKLLSEERLCARLTFRPQWQHRPVEREFLTRAMTRADHHWVIAAPSCDVEGTIDVDGSALRFNGRGYHDHNYGSAPIGPGLKRWIWGRVLTETKAATFHVAVPEDPKLPDERHVLIVDEAGIRDVSTESGEPIRFNRRTVLALAYPDNLSLSNELTIRNPRVIDSTPFYLRLIYDADFGGQQATAFCEVAYPRRLLWPILGRMIEMSIDKRAMG